MRSRRKCVLSKIEDSHYIFMIFRKKFSKKNFKNFRPIRLRNFAPKTSSNERLLLAYSKTVFRIEIGTVVRELSRFEVFNLTILRNFFEKNSFFLEKNACANVVTMFKRKPIKNYVRIMTFDGKQNLQTRQNFGSKIEISRP